MFQIHTLLQTFQQIKGRAGYLLNLKTEPWLGRHVSLQQSFPYLVARKVSQPRFLTVRIDIINKCNLRCKMCYFSMEKLKQQPRIEMPVELFEKIAAQVFPVAKQVLISAGAEPLYAPKFPQMLEIAARYALPHLSFFTNGTLLNEQNIETIIRSGVNVIILSFDGATPETYQAIRRGARFEQVVSNIRTLQTMKAKLGSSTPALHFGVVLMKSNIHELPDLLRLAKELGIAHVTASHLVPYAELNTKEESLTLHQDLANTYLDQARQVAREIGLSFDVPPNFTKNTEASFSEENQPVPPTRCHWPWDEILIRPDGSVNPCCYWYENLSMGNFHTRSFKQIWHGKAYKQLRRELENGTLREMCQKCPEMNARRTEVDVVN